MRESRPDQPDVDPETVGAGPVDEEPPRGGMMSYLITQSKLFITVVVLFIIGIIAIIVYANVY